MKGLLKNPLINIIDLQVKNVKVLKLIINFGIFVSIFAITAAIISIYFETKINKIEEKIIYNHQRLHVAEYSLARSPINIQSKMQHINQSKIKSMFYELDKYHSIPTFDEMQLAYVPLVEYFSIVKNDLRLSYFLREHIVKLVISENKKISLLKEYKITKQDIEKIKKKYPSFHTKYLEIKKREKEIGEIDPKKDNNIVKKKETFPKALLPADSHKKKEWKKYTNSGLQKLWAEVRTVDNSKYNYQWASHHNFQDAYNLAMDGCEARRKQNSKIYKNSEVCIVMFIGDEQTTDEQKIKYVEKYYGKKTSNKSSNFIKKLLKDPKLLFNKKKLTKEKKITKKVVNIKNDYKSYSYNKKKLEFLYESWMAYFDLQFEGMKILRNETNLIKKLNLNLQKEISLISSKSSKIILAAFFLQLFIFIIIQALEISTTINAGKNEKR